MFGRNAQPSSSSHALPEDTFVEDVGDLFAETLVSAQRVSKLLQKATKAGVKHIPKRLKKSCGKNAARDRTRFMLRKTKWAEYYWFQCRVRNRKTEEEYTTGLPINLPLEVLEMLWDLGCSEVLLDESNLDTTTKKHMDWIRGALDAETMWGFGIHGDGVPCNYDRTESVIMISLNLPGLPGKNGRLRIPLFCLPDWAVSEHTFDDVNNIIAWSMRHLLTGSRPVCRHDATAFGERDKKRAKKVCEALPFKACLCQARADWDWMAKCFHFPFHNVKGGCCWLCNVKRKQVQLLNLPPPTQQWLQHLVWCFVCHHRTIVAVFTMVATPL
jgi:hypothetical protein